VPSNVRLRLFITCWIIYVAHFATDFAREHYLVVSIVEDHSYLLDKYYGMHPDIFINPPNSSVKGAHHGANPGISMLAAIPYFVLKPAVDAVVNRELAARKTRPAAPVRYDDNRPKRVAFYNKVRTAGLDIRFGLVSAITNVFVMAPISAASVVLMYMLLGTMGLRQRMALWLSLLYGLGTPVLFRTAYLNQNLGLGMCAFVAFSLIWNPGGFVGWRTSRRLFTAGLLGGFAFLCDYSGALLMGLLGFYAWWRSADDRGLVGGFKDSLWYLAGAIPMILLLFHYQYASFGNAILPPQNWMAPVEWIDVGYKGVGGFSPELFRMLLVDGRFGLFIAMPLALLALAAPWLASRGRSPLPAREAWVCLILSAVLIVFFSTVQYTRLQWVTGIRYIAPAIPFLFLAAVPALLRLPRLLSYGVIIVSVVISWSIAMVRSQGTVMENVERVFVEGFQLPWLTVMTKLSAQYLPWFRGTVSVLPIFALCGVVLFIVWRVQNPWRRLDHEV
jgi:hypothetical protein